MDGREFVDDDIVGQIDRSNFFLENLFPPIIVDGPLSVASPDSWTVEIENLLMEDNDDPVPEALSESDSKEYCDKFLADLFVGGVEDDSSPSGKDAANTGLDENKVDPTADDPISLNAGLDKDNVDATADDPISIDAPLDKEYVNATADDPISKKRTRQMRNRDAAVRSRERKKMYVKNLEINTRYLEGECRRLGHLLHCCYAENHALRLCLQSSAFGASMTKLESAVLLMESLLLGSLLWFVGIICQLSLPLVPWLIPEVVPLENMEQKGQKEAALEGARNNILWYFVVQSFVKSRRSRASRTRMKMNFVVF